MTNNTKNDNGNGNANGKSTAAPLVYRANGIDDHLHPVIAAYLERYPNEEIAALVDAYKETAAFVIEERDRAIETRNEIQLLTINLPQMPGDEREDAYARLAMLQASRASAASVIANAAERWATAALEMHRAIWTDATQRRAALTAERREFREQERNYTTARMRLGMGFDGPDKREAIAAFEARNAEMLDAIRRIIAEDEFVRSAQLDSAALAQRYSGRHYERHSDALYPTPLDVQTWSRRYGSEFAVSLN